MTKLKNVTFHNTNISCNIGIIWEPGHEDPWIIAMDAKPNSITTLNYGKRFSIEGLFSDLKSRGFDIEKTQLKSNERIERLMLLVTIAFYYAVSVGISIAKVLSEKQIVKKNTCDQYAHFLLPEFGLSNPFFTTFNPYPL
jgi:transposase